MPLDLFSEYYRWTVTSGGTTAPAALTQETWTVASSTGAPPASNTASPPTVFRIVDVNDTNAPPEIMLVINISGTTWTVLRGAEGGPPTAHASNWVAIPVLTSQALASVKPNILQQYGISASLNYYSGSTSGANQTVVTLGAHDFQVGHGIRLYGGTAVGMQVPAAPVIASTGTNGGTVTYSYQVACIQSATYDGCSAASPITTFQGNATLSASNYNRIQFTPVVAMTASVVYGYAIYGRIGGSMQLIGTYWLHSPTHFSCGLVASNLLPPYLGSNLAPSTTYGYTITGVDYYGNESPPLVNPAPTVTTGATVYGINVYWDFFYGIPMGYRYYNIYRQTGAGPLQFMQQVPIADRVWQDYGAIVPNASQNPPTMVTYVDNGQPFLNGTGSYAGGGPGRLPQVPVTPPAANINASLFSKVNAVTPTTVTVANNIGPQLTNALVTHDDTAAIGAAALAIRNVVLPDGFYPIGYPLQIPDSGTVNHGGSVQGEHYPLTITQSVSQNANPLPNPYCTTLVFTSFNTPGNNGSMLWLHGMGTAARKLQFFWPYQTNGSLQGNNVDATNGSPSYIPFACSVLGSQVNQEVTDIVDCNSWIGYKGTGTSVKAERWWVGSLRWAVYAEASECVFHNFKGDPGYVYSGNLDLPRAPDRTCIKGASSGLPEIDTLLVDSCTAVWWTLSAAGANSNGNIGLLINQVWTDDWGPSGVIDCPVSEPYNGGGGAVFDAKITNWYAIPGSGPFNITSLNTRMYGGTNSSYVGIANSVGTFNLTGNFHAHFSGCPGVAINTYAKQRGDQTTPIILLSMTGCGMSLPRIHAWTGATKAMISSGLNSVLNHWFNDQVEPGATLYVLDEQGMHEEPFVIPAGTPITTAGYTAGYLIVNQQPNVSQTLYIIDVSGSGSSATDSWSLSGNALFTTPNSVSGLFTGGAGESKDVQAGTTRFTALVTLTPGAGSSQVVYPVVLTPAANLTTAQPLKCRIKYCLTPVST